MPEQQTYSIDELLAQGLVPKPKPMPDVPFTPEANAGRAPNAVTQLFADTQPEVDQANVAEEIAMRLNKTQDVNRLDVGCALINVLNYAVQKQANRENWTTADYKAFIIALSAIDRIGIESQQAMR